MSERLTSDAMLSMEYLIAEIRRQDGKHGRFTDLSELGQARLAVACLEDEVREARNAWRKDRQVAGWPHLQAELLQVAAVAMRALRDLP